MYATFPVLGCATLATIVVSLITGGYGDVTPLHDNNGHGGGKMAAGPQGMVDFVRLARPSGFVRIGKMDHRTNADEAADEPDNRMMMHGEPVKKSTTKFVRDLRFPNMNRFVRIGRGHFQSTDDDDEDDDDDNTQRWRSPSSSKAKRPSSFLRIGKANGGGEDTYEKKASNFVRFGKSYSRNGGGGKRKSGFIRIGKSFQDEQVVEGKRGSSGFVRIGKSNNLERNEKRPSGFVRIGKDVYSKRPSGFVRIGKSYETDEEYGKGDSKFLGIHTNPAGKRIPGFVRIGKSPNDNMMDAVRSGDKRSSNFLRIGKSGSSLFDDGNENDDDDDDDGEKRSSSFVRFGKSSLDEMLPKRASSFVRFGKSDLFHGGLDLDDVLSSSFHRKERSAFNDGFRTASLLSEGPTQSEDKRSSNFLRIGKSGSSLFDDGNQNDDDDDDGEKRSSSFVRFGKSSLDEMLPKRASNFVRFGKSDWGGNNDDGDFDNNKRASSFVRFGKASSSHAAESGVDDLQNIKKSSSFVRIGKQQQSSANDHRDHSSGYITSHSALGDRINKRPMGVSRRGSAFVRIGKIPSAAFVPVGHNLGRVFEMPAGRRVGYRRRNRNGQFSFVRIG